MTIEGVYSSIASSLTQRSLSASLKADKASSSPGAVPVKQTTAGNDIVVISAIAPSPNKARLLSQSEENIQGGFRRTKNFVNSEGRNFTRSEEYTLSERSAKRTVVQQNPSGSITTLEEQIDQQDDGLFRRTRRFTDAAGETFTTIEIDLTSAETYIVGGSDRASIPYNVSFQQNIHRGSQLNIQV